MLERELTISNRLGLHARATAKLVQTLSGFRCNATLAAKGREVNAKSIMGLLTLEGNHGAKMKIHATGADAAAALDALAELFEQKFFED